MKNVLWCRDFKFPKVSEGGAGTQVGHAVLKSTVMWTPSSYAKIQNSKIQSSGFESYKKLFSNIRVRFSRACWLK